MALIMLCLIRQQECPISNYLASSLGQLGLKLTDLDVLTSNNNYQFGFSS